MQAKTLPNADDLHDLAAERVPEEAGSRRCREAPEIAAQARLIVDATHARERGQDDASRPERLICASHDRLNVIDDVNRLRQHETIKLLGR